MSKLGKAESQIEINCHADKVFQTWTHKPHLISKFCPHKYSKIELNQGNWGDVGSIRTWHYMYNGKHEFVKTKITEIDEKNKSVTLAYINEGQIMEKYYNYLQSKFQVIPKDENHCIMKWRIDYEKKIDDAPGAGIYVDFILGSAKELEAHI